MVAVIARIQPAPDVNIWSSPKLSSTAMIRVRGKRLAKTPYMAQGLLRTKKQPIIEATKLMRPIIASVANKE
jgi:hypothetical protein